MYLDLVVKFRNWSDATNGRNARYNQTGQCLFHFSAAITSSYAFSRNLKRLVLLREHIVVNIG